MVSLHHSYHRKCIDFDDHQCYFLKMLASYSSHSYLIIGMDSSQNFPRAGSKFGIFWIGGCGEMERDIRCTVSEVSEPTASSSQNSLTGALVASSSQNSLTGTGVASSSQNSMTGGCGSCGSDPTTTGGETEGILGSDLTCGEAAGSAENSEAGKISLVCLREEDIPGASLNGWQPSQLHVVELKRWLKCRGATTAGKKADLVKRLE